MSRNRLPAILSQRCPQCLEGPVFRGLVRMHPRCPVCSLGFEREPGYFVGAMYFSYAMAVPLVGVLALIARWFRPDWSFAQLLSIAAIAALPVAPVLFRYSRVVWLHLDRAFDPD